MMNESSVKGQHYEIVSVRSAEPPPGVKGSNWHQYVIAFEGSNTINGYQQGNLRAVTTAVREMVAQLNERHMGHSAKPRRVQLVLKK